MENPTATRLALITSALTMQAEFLDTIAEIERPLAEAIAARTGTGGLGPEVLAAVSVAARVAAERWLQPEPDTKSLAAILHDALIWIAPPLRSADQ